MKINELKGLCEIFYGRNDTIESVHKYKIEQDKMMIAIYKEENGDNSYLNDLEKYFKEKDYSNVDFLDESNIKNELLNKILSVLKKCYTEKLNQKKISNNNRLIYYLQKNNLKEMKKYLKSKEDVKKKMFFKN